MNGSRSWVAMDAALLQDPVPVIDYVSRKRFHNKPKFEVVRKMMKDETKMAKYRQAFKAKVSKAPRYHFGVEVPRNIKHALQLDRINKNNLWKEATE